MRSGINSRRRLANMDMALTAEQILAEKLADENRRKKQKPYKVHVEVTYDRSNIVPRTPPKQS
jgi:hypothetical protein